jgi:hypothetical protein
MNASKINTKAKMNTYAVRQGFLGRADATVIALRKEGFAAHGESDESGKQFYIVTDAPRSTVLFVAGHGQMLY